MKTRGILPHLCLPRLEEHKRPVDLHSEVHGAQSPLLRFAVKAAAFCGAATFGPLFLGLSFGWWTGNPILHGPDQYPYIAYTGAISVLAILMNWLILLATSYQSALDTVLRDNAYRQIAELDALQREQMDLLAKQDVQIQKLDTILATIRAHHALTKH